jgi:hypothetical protein
MTENGRVMRDPIASPAMKWHRFDQKINRISFSENA